ncbi:acyltransferase [Aeromonas hydrophila]|uniref:acyltransferase n=1 Tax=Aeromonas hydrophila TaxID=644 RepID=UPI00114CC8B0|nr:acyltransferase [Aeromonas hydrophila]
MNIHNLMPFLRIRARTITFYIKHKLMMPSIFLSKMPIVAQRIIFRGLGTIKIGNNVILGSYPSPGHKYGEMYLEARHKDGIISIGSNVSINNGAVIISDKDGVSIGDNCLIGPNFMCFDSDFHSILPSSRHSNNYSSREVSIGENVFIGANVIVLKGSTIGKNSVIGAGCTISGYIPENVIVTCHKNNNVVNINE